MDRSTRDRFVASTDQADLMYGPSACLETPPELFEALDQEFHFDVDLCANETNHKLPMWFGPGSPTNVFDCLTAPWMYAPSLPEEIAQGLTPTTTGFGNPPYGTFIKQYLIKAKQEAEKGFLSVHLLPLRITKVFKQIVLPYADIRFVNERVKFWYQGVPKLTLNSKTQEMEHMGALFDSYLVIFRPRDPNHLFYPKAPEVWTWKKKK